MIEMMSPMLAKVQPKNDTLIQEVSGSHNSSQNEGSEDGFEPAAAREKGMFVAPLCSHPDFTYQVFVMKPNAAVERISDAIHCTRYRLNTSSSGYQATSPKDYHIMASSPLLTASAGLSGASIGGWRCWSERSHIECSSSWLTNDSSVGTLTLGPTHMVPTCSLKVMDGGPELLLSFVFQAVRVGTATIPF